MKTKKIIGIILTTTILAACIVSVIILMQGETKTSGQNPANVEGKTLVCESTGISYPITTYDNSTNKDLRIILNSYNNKIDTIYLAYELFYNNSQQIVASEAINHADMNTSFGKNSLGADAFNAHYSKMENSMKMTLYAKADEINPITAKYFMINARDTEEIPNNIQEYQNNYEQQGFACTLNSK